MKGPTEIGVRAVDAWRKFELGVFELSINQREADALPVHDSISPGTSIIASWPHDDECGEDRRRDNQHLPVFYPPGNRRRLGGDCGWGVRHEESPGQTFCRFLAVSEKDPRFASAFGSESGLVDWRGYGS